MRNKLNLKSAVESMSKPSSKTVGVVNIMNFSRSKIAICLSSMCLSTQVVAGPTGAEVVHGEASFIENGNHLEISSSNGTIINWQDFSIANHESVNFLQTHASSAILNRVISNIPSNILGDLTSNGRVFVINPNGLLIGNDSVIDTAGFVASTLNISDSDFIAGRMKFVGDSGEIENHGYIAAGPGGEIILIAPNVENHGVIESDGGQILLAAGREVTLHSTQSGGLSYRVSAPGDKVLNIGKLLAENGSVKVFADQIFQQGDIQANRARQLADGSIVLEADRQIEVSGTISAQGDQVEGGKIHLLGDQVDVVDAQIDASGEGGGEILIGGDYQGDGDVRNAANTNTDAASVIRADGGIKGDGGRVIVWSDNTTNSYAKITARGGSVSGDGGFVETSGKKVLDFGQAVDVSATSGAAGTWLLDPEDIVIDDEHAASISTSLNGGSNVEVRTSDEGDGEGNITVESAIIKSEGDAAVTLTLDAHNRVDVNAPITTTAGPLNLEIKTGRQVANVDVESALDSQSPDDAETDESAASADDEQASNDENGVDSVAEATPDSEAGDDEEEGTVGESNAGDESDIIAQSSADETEESEAIDAIDSSDPARDEGGEQSETTELAENPENAGVDSAGEESEAQALDEDLVADSSDLNSDVEVPESSETEQADDAADSPQESIEASDTPELDRLVDEQSQQIVIADEIQTGGGTISVNAGANGDTIIAANITSSDASGSSAGDIIIEGENIAVVEEATITASGEEAGSIYIGGGKQGQDEEIENSSVVYLADGTTVSADGGSNGNGGTVIVFSEENTRVDGAITARGGTESGDGGFIETSGLNGFSVSDAPDTSAANGEGGEWLIDPYNIEIGHSGESYSNTQVTPFSFSGSSSVTPTGTPAFVDVRLLEEALSYGDVTIATTNAAIGEDGNIDVTAAINSFDTNDLTLLADSQITIGAEIRSYGGLVLQAGSDVQINESIVVDGYLDVYAGNDILVRGTLESQDASVYLEADNDIVINSSINSDYYIGIYANADELGGGGVTISNDNPVTGGAGHLYIEAGGLYSTDSVINITGNSLDIISTGGSHSFSDGQISLSAADINFGHVESEITGDINILSQPASTLGSGPYLYPQAGGSISIESKYDTSILAGGDLTIEAGHSSYVNYMGYVYAAGGTNNDIRIQSKYGNQTISASNISISSGAGERSHVLIEAPGNRRFDSEIGVYIEDGTGIQTITTTGDMTLNSRVVTPGDSYNELRGDYVSIVSGNQQTITVGGDLTLTGRHSDARLARGRYDAFNTQIIAYGNHTMSVGGALSMTQSEIRVSSYANFNSPVGGTSGFENSITVGDFHADQASISFERSNTNPGSLTFTTNGPNSTINNTQVSQLSQTPAKGEPVSSFVFLPTSGNALTLGSLNWVNNGTVDWQSGTVQVERATMPPPLFGQSEGFSENESSITNNGRLELNSEEGSFNVVGSDEPVNLVNSSTGTIVKDTGTGTSYLNANIVSQGTIIAQSGHLELGEFGLEQTGGALELRGGSIGNDGMNAAFSFTNSTISGGYSDLAGYSSGGSILANVTIAGTEVSPGFSPGNITISGDFDASAGGNSFIFEVDEFSAASSAGEGWDLLTITGEANITTSGMAGANTVTVDSSLVFPSPAGDPPVSDSFTLIQAGSGSIALLDTTHLNVPGDVEVSEFLANGNTEFGVNYQQMPAEVEVPEVEVPDVEEPIAETPVPPEDPTPPVEEPPAPDPEPEIIIVIIDEKPVALPLDIVDVLVSLSDEEREAYLESERVRQVIKTVNMCSGKV